MIIRETFSSKGKMKKDMNKTIKYQRKNKGREDEKRLMDEEDEKSDRLMMQGRAGGEGGGGAVAEKRRNWERTKKTQNAEKDIGRKLIHTHTHSLIVITTMMIKMIREKKRGWKRKQCTEKCRCVFT